MDCFAALAMTMIGLRAIARFSSGTTPVFPAFIRINRMKEGLMGRYLLLWLLGIPLPILVLIYAFGGLNH
jgi:hypothetical protein